MRTWCMIRGSMLKKLVAWLAESPLFSARPCGRREAVRWLAESPLLSAWPCGRRAPLALQERSGDSPTPKGLAVRWLALLCLLSACAPANAASDTPTPVPPALTPMVDLVEPEATLLPT